jgi:type VI secretion system secreted protein Hcp
MANTNLYLKLDGIDGESLDQDHVGWIELTGWSFGAHNAATFAVNQGGQAKQAQFTPFNVQKHCDKSSPILAKNVASGKHIHSGIVSCMKLNGDARVEYLKYEFKDLMVSSVVGTCGAQDDHVSESIDLVFAEFKMEYKLQNDKGSAAGTVDMGFNIQTSRVS